MTKRRIHILHALVFIACVMALARMSLANPPSTGQNELSWHGLPYTFTDQHGQPFKFSDLNGTPALVSMMYTSCQYSCPMIVSALQRYERTVVAKTKKYKVIMITFDPERDTKASLQTLQKKHSLDGTHWTLLTPKVGDEREIAALLGVKFRRRNDGDFNHNNVIGFMNSNGSMIGKTEKISEIEEDLVNKFVTTR